MGWAGVVRQACILHTGICDSTAQAGLVRYRPFTLEPPGPVGVVDLLLQPPLLLISYQLSSSCNYRVTYLCMTAVLALQVCGARDQPGMQLCTARSRAANKPSKV